ncbi:MAG: FG-GAP repeat domain-containing protein [Woeseiaceae bacterium]
MKGLKWFLSGLGALILTALIAVIGMGLADSRIDYDVSTDGVVIPTYSTVEIPFDQSNDFSTAHPFAAGAIIDVDNDGTEELFLGGGPGQSDALFRFVDESFQEISLVAGITKSMDSASFGATVIDTDGDGRDDLIVSRSDGVWLHRNQGNSFSNQKLRLDMPADTTPMSVAVADLNRDGHYDLFVAGYIRLDLVEGQNIFNKQGYGGSSRLFMNRGDNTFEDVTDKAGLTYVHNTFMGIFVDIDQDGFEDLVVAHDTGQVRTWKNRGDGSFDNRDNPNSDFYSYPMGIAVGDYNNDGRVDFAFSNVGGTPPDFLIRGDLTDEQVSNWKWLLFKNKGNFEFEDAADEAKIADYEFSWGMTFEDLNLDGRQDLIVSENYIGLPPQKLPFLRAPGRLLIQNTEGEFAAVGKQAGVVNKRYSISPIVADFNHDGYSDIVHVNLAGRSQAFISEGGDNGFLKVKLPNRVSSIAASVEVTLNNGSILTQPFVSGEGLCSDSSHVMTFGLELAHVTNVKVAYIDGTRTERNGNYRNQLLQF